MSLSCRQCGRIAASLRRCAGCGALDAYVPSSAAPTEPAPPMSEVKDAPVYAAFADGIHATLRRVVDDSQDVGESDAWLVGFLAGTLRRVQEAGS